MLEIFGCQCRLTDTIDSFSKINRRTAKLSARLLPYCFEVRSDKLTSYWELKLAAVFLGFAKSVRL